jgi:hypothetical protein
MEGRIPRGLEETIIDGQTLIRIAIPELSKLRDKYRAEVKAEQNAARVAAGQSSRPTLSPVSAPDLIGQSPNHAAGDAQAATREGRARQARAKPSTDDAMRSAR